MAKRKKRKLFKISRKTGKALLVGAVAIPIGFSLASKGASKLGDVGAGLEKVVPK